MLKSLLLTIFLGSLLTACATTASHSNPQDFELGKRQFLNQKYQQAFPKLFAAAKDDNADAAYAVGYMFYYGKGTKQNKMLGENWIAKAAAAGNATAKQALQIIEQEQAASSTSEALN